MDQESLRRFAPFYVNARHLGADALLRRYLELPDDFIVPAYVSHGVDFGFSLNGFDIYKPEPIYWATNEHSARLAERHKPVIRMPHPFLLAAWGQEIGIGHGSLVIGPPPGRENDRNMLSLLGGRDRDDLTILVKPHSGRIGSRDFWRGAGYRTVSLLDAGPPSYETMAALFGGFRDVIAGTVSSAVFFAAALGKPVSFLRGYRFRAYEGLNIFSIVDYRAKEARRNVRILVEGSREAATEMARAVLGEPYSRDRVGLRDRFLTKVAELELPVYCRHRLPRPLKRLVASAALRARRPSLLATSLPEFIRGRMTKSVLIIDIDEVSQWVDGWSDDNLRFDQVRYIRGEREPGTAVDPY